MFGRRDHQRDSLIKLDTSKRRDAHVQKYTKQHSQRNMTQHIGHNYRQTWMQETEKTELLKCSLMKELYIILFQLFKYN